MLLEKLDREFDSSITVVHMVLDNFEMHKGKLVRAWLAPHPRFQFHPPVHCSWMNQVEPWFSILQRKRFGIVDFADKKHLAERLEAFVREWNRHAHSFHPRNGSSRFRVSREVAHTVRDERRESAGGDSPGR